MHVFMSILDGVKSNNEYLKLEKDHTCLVWFFSSLKCTVGNRCLEVIYHSRQEW
jgi:hypothetical protein